jgi:hypothetical protein
VVVLTVLPSLYLAYGLVVEEVFKSRAAHFVASQPEFRRAHVAAVKADSREHLIEVTLIGTPLAAEVVSELAGRLPDEGLEDVHLQIIQSNEQKVDVAALKADLLRGLYQESQAQLAAKEKQIQQLQAQLQALKARRAQFLDVPPELHALNPRISQVFLAETPEWNARTGLHQSPTVLLNLRASKRLSRAETARIEQWLRTRVKSESVKVVAETGKL